MSVGLAVLGGAAVGLVVAAVAKSGSSAEAPSKSPERGAGSAPKLPPSAVLPKPAGAPFAEGIARPVWPVKTDHPRGLVVSYRGEDGKVRGNWARRFAAPRESSKGNRKHAGVDLFAFAGDEVLSMADGTITAVQSFHLGSWAVFVDHGAFTVLYAEVDKGSWSRLGLGVGSSVRAGQPIAEVACMRRDENGRCVSHMLHLETYRSGTKKNLRWYADDAAPAALLDPSLVLLLAAHQPGTSPAVA